MSRGVKNIHSRGDLVSTNCTLLGTIILLRSLYGRNRYIISAWALTLSVRLRWAVGRASDCGTDNRTVPRSFINVRHVVKSLTKYHQDMETYSTTSDVKNERSISTDAASAGFVPDALPEVQSGKETNSQTGVSAENALSPNDLPKLPKKEHDITRWHVLRATYGREKAAYGYFVDYGVEAFYPKLTTMRVVDNERRAIEESRIPNILFVHMSERKLKLFLKEAPDLSYIRFYKTPSHVANRKVLKPLIIPDREMESLRIICESESQNVLISLQNIDKFEQGQTVKVIDGEFKGVEGVVARYQGQQRVGVVINNVMTVMTAYVPSAFLEKIE